MRKKNMLYILLLLFGVFFYLYSEVNRPREVDWNESFSPEDKIPFGTYIVTRSLPFLFPDGSVEFPREPVLEYLETRFGEAGNPIAYIFVNNSFISDPVEISRLLDIVKEGNCLFISAMQMPDTLLSFFHLKIEHVYGEAKHRLAGVPDKEYIFRKQQYAYFDLPEGESVDILGTVDTAAYPDFIRLPLGNGQVFLNLNPHAYTNYYLLDSVQGDYYYRTLSFLPPDASVLWDEYKVLGPEGDSSPFRVILRYPALKGAWYLLLICGLLYVVFRFKREQRAVPVVSPPENKMLEFMEAVSSLYYKQKDHRGIALKRIDFFLEVVRRRYKLPTANLDASFIRSLSERSGVSERKISELAELMVQIWEADAIREKQLVRLVKYMDLFKE